MLLSTEVTQIIYYNSKQVYSIWFGNIYNRSLEIGEENVHLKRVGHFCSLFVSPQGVCFGQPLSED